MVQLGQLETAAMEHLWASESPMSVREMLEHLNEDRDLAYTTVLTVLDHLHRKEIVRREKAGRAYVYRPAASRSDYTAELMQQVLAANPDRGSALMRFVEALPADEVDELRRALGDSGGHQDRSRRS